MDYCSECVRENVFKGEFGLEKESLRVFSDGKIALTSHPFATDLHIGRDFSESQLEFITSVHSSVSGVLSELESLHRKAYSVLDKRASQPELIWPFSNPGLTECEDNIPVATFEGEKKEKQVYREYLAKKYGKKKMLLSGVHVNFSFPEKMLLECYHTLEVKEDFKTYKNNLYLYLATCLIDKAWLMVILTAASPVYDKSFVSGEKKSETVYDGQASIRCGKDGYWNEFIPYLDFSSLENYVSSIKKYILSGDLCSESELYCPVRLKPKGINSLEALRKRGVNHLEFRMLDLNPNVAMGVEEKDVLFIHLLMIYLLRTQWGCKRKKEKMNLSRYGKTQQRQAYEKVKRAALYDIDSMREEALEVLSEMEKHFGDDLPKEYHHVIKFQKEKLLSENKRYASVIKKEFEKDYIKKGVELAKRHRAYFERLS